MKKVLLSILLMACFMVIPQSPVNAQQDYGDPKAGIYVGYEAGVRFLDLDEETGVESDIDPGFVNSILVGYANGNGLRGELVSSFSRNNYKATVAVSSSASVIIDSSFDIYTGMARGFYDINLSSEQITPFIGAGIGWSRVETSAKITGTNLTIVAGENYFTYSGIAGFRFAATDNFSIGARYGFSGYGGDGFAHDAMASFSYAF